MKRSISGNSLTPWKILPLIVLLAGCVATPTVQPGEGTLAPSIPDSATLTANPGSLVTPVSNGTTLPSQVPFTLTNVSPADQSIVSQSTIEIKGEVSREAVLSINNDFYLVPAGPFSKPVTLVEGPNSIQIVASDMLGNEIDLILTITYQP